MHAFRLFNARELHQNPAFALRIFNAGKKHAKTAEAFAEEVDGFGNVAARFLAQNAFDCGIAVVGIDAVHAVEFLRKADARHKFFIFLAEYADEIVFGVLARVCQRFVQLGILRVGSLGADDVGHGNLQRHGHAACCFLFLQITSRIIAVMHAYKQPCANQANGDCNNNGNKRFLFHLDFVRLEKYNYLHVTNIRYLFQVGNIYFAFSPFFSCDFLAMKPCGRSGVCDFLYLYAKF